MQPIESEGRTVAEAVEAALSRNGLRREQVEVTVLQEGSAGFMGIGAKPARVRLTEKRWGEGPPAVSKPAPPPSRPSRAPAPRPSAPPPRPFIPAPKYVAPPPKPAAPRPAAPKPENRPPSPRPQPRSEPRAPRERERAPSRAITPAEAVEACAKAQALVGELLALMTIAAPTVTAAWDADMERVKLSVESQDAPLLVGRDGRVLESLQFLATLMMSRGAEAPVAVQVDALSYWEKRETAILDVARKAVESVKADGKPVRLEPMDASMRRLIHRTFASNPDATTSSEGEGPWRKIVVRPRAK
jgi:spoIIIJ-associated protein